MDALPFEKADAFDLNLKANQSTTFTNMQTNALFDAKANSNNVDAGLALKANQSTPYTKALDFSAHPGGRRLDDRFGEQCKPNIFR